MENCDRFQCPKGFHFFLTIIYYLDDYTVTKQQEQNVEIWQHVNNLSFPYLKLIVNELWPSKISQNIWLSEYDMYVLLHYEVYIHLWTNIHLLKRGWVARRMETDKWPRHSLLIEDLKEERNFPEKQMR